MKKDSIPASPPPTVNTTTPNSPTTLSPKLPRDIINTQASNYRVAQACDRCRSKKIRCDGKRPTCSQCAAVGFECRITDKLIRRAFPRGYTESLEERVRELEAENRRLLALCDLKEQQINIVTQYSRAGSNPTAEHPQTSTGYGSNDNTTSTTTKNNNNNNNDYDNDGKNGESRDSDHDHDHDRDNDSNGSSHILNISQTNLILLNQTHRRRRHQHQQLRGPTVSQSGLNSPAASDYKQSEEKTMGYTRNEDIGVRNDLKDLVMDHSCDRILCDHDEAESPMDTAAKNMDSSRLQYNGDANSPTNKVNSGKLHLKPVSTRHTHNPESISFEQDEAPGLLAARALKSVKNHERSSQLTVLVALSIPRSTFEILFVPQLLAKVRDLFGFTSKHCLYTVTLLSSLKYKWPPPNSNGRINKSQGVPPKRDKDTSSLLRDTNLWDIDDIQRFLKEVLRFNIFTEGISIKSDNDNIDDSGNAKIKSKGKDKHANANANANDDLCLTLDEIDELVSLYFEHCSGLIPVLNKDEFDMFYNDFKQNLKQSAASNGTAFPSPFDRIVQFNCKFFACLLVVICQMGILAKIKNERNTSEKLLRLCAYYHNLIPCISQNPYFTLSTTSIKSLQLFALIFFYYLNCGDIIQIYTLRGKVICMEQQLRLQRCPSAVLTVSGSSVSSFEESNRRFLFWTIYYLDVFASLQLGIPRLIKDYEIECALPLAEKGSNTTSNDNQAASPNTVKLEGQVTHFSLALLRFSKILGSIMDRIFERNMAESATESMALIYENALDNWRSSLPSQYLFKLDVNGSIDLSEAAPKTTVEFEKMVLVFLYFLARCVIHLPIFATTALSHGSPADSNSSSGNKYSSSYVSLQQATNTMLHAYRAISGRYVALPINLAKSITRFSLISLQGSLDYIKGGSLYIDNKNLLLGVIQNLEADRKLDLPGAISWDSLRLFDLTVTLFLHGVNVKPQKLNKILEKRLNYYNKLMGEQPTKNFDLDPLKVIEESDSSQAEEAVPAKVENDLNRDMSPPTHKDERDVHHSEGPLTKKLKTKHEGHLPLESIPPKNENVVSPELTQTVFAEAMQLDPVVNQNLLQPGGQNPGGFFTNGEDMNMRHTISKSSNTEAANNTYASNRGNATLGTTDTGNNVGSNTKSNSKHINSVSNFDRIVNVPSWADFFSGLQSVLPPSNNFGSVPPGVADNSGQLSTRDTTLTNQSNNANNNSLLNMFMLMNGENVSQQYGGQFGKGSNVYGMADPTSNGGYPVVSFGDNVISGSHMSDFNLNAMTSDFFNPVTDFGHVVDASLGLAPLLIAEEGGVEHSDQMAQGDTMLNLGQEEASYMGPSGIGDYSRNNLNNRVITDTGDQGNGVGNNEPGLMIEAPRRFGSGNNLTPPPGSYSNTDGDGQQESQNDIHYSYARRNKNTGAIVDLYNWQNSK